MRDATASQSAYVSVQNEWPARPVGAELAAAMHIKFTRRPPGKARKAIGDRLQPR
jgi:hypothetical protein